MDKRKSVIIIGSGIGGIATAGYLAYKGYDVTIFEKNAYPGGRCGRYVQDEHRFDIGATFLMMPGVYENTYSAIGLSMIRANGTRPGTVGMAPNQNREAERGCGARSCATPPLRCEALKRQAPRVPEIPESKPNLRDGPSEAGWQV